MGSGLADIVNVRKEKSTQKRGFPKVILCMCWQFGGYDTRTSSLKSEKKMGYFPVQFEKTVALIGTKIEF
jgi:hypothetical protein